MFLLVAENFARMVGILLGRAGGTSIIQKDGENGSEDQPAAFQYPCHSHVAVQGPDALFARAHPDV